MLFALILLTTTTDLLAQPGVAIFEYAIIIREPKKTPQSGSYNVIIFLPLGMMI